MRREGNRVLVNVQLIDASEDRHLWAEHYDRALSDLIGLQGELLTQIAATLKAKLAPEEKARVESKVTDNPEAYVLYLKALQREGMVNASREDKIAAEQLYMQATTIAPTFALAYARASLLNSELAVPAGEEDPERQAKARAQADQALRLVSRLGEAHMALGLCLYWGEKDYFAALMEFSLAAAASPNDADILYYISGIYRRQGRWRESIASLQRAQDLDPRNHRIAIFVAHNYLVARDWPAATAAYNRALEIAWIQLRPGLVWLIWKFFETAHPLPRGQFSRKYRRARIKRAHHRSSLGFRHARARFRGGRGILGEVALKTFPDVKRTSQKFFRGTHSARAGRYRNGTTLPANSTSAYESWTSKSSDAPRNTKRWDCSMPIWAEKEDAIREGRLALKMEPESQNAFHGAARAATLALIYALVGEADRQFD